MISSLILLIFGLFFILKGYFKGLLVVLIISLTNDLLKLPFSFSLSIHHTLALLYSPVIFKFFIKDANIGKWVITPLIYEIIYLIFLALIFGFIIPWRSDYDYLRSWNQQAEGRAIVQVIRLFADLSLVFLVYYLLETQKITLDSLLKIFAGIITLSLAIVLVNYFLDNRIKILLFPEVGRDIANRFTGFNNEPRSLGRVFSISALFLLTFWERSRHKIVQIGIIAAFLGLLLSFSASAIIMTLVWILVLVVSTRKNKVILVTFIVSLVAWFIVPKSEVFQNQTKGKIAQVLAIENSKTSQDNDVIDKIEPKFFVRFEVFDRAALNFLYRNPFYGIIGTGPNLISIPASSYLSRHSRAIYGQRIDSVPHSLFINILARSGFIGLLAWTIFVGRMSIFLGSQEKSFFWGLIAATLVVNNVLFFFCTGVLLSLSERNND